MSSFVNRVRNCPGCARRRKKIGRVITSLSYSRIIKMPWHMNPGWLPSIERDNWIAHRDRALYMMGIKDKHGLRRYQRGSVSAFVQAAAAQQGAGGDCTFTESTIPNLIHNTISPTTAYVQARLHSDGDWYSHSGSLSFGASDGTWQGDCAVADYDSRWSQTAGADVPNSQVTGTDGTWHAATTSAALGYVNNEAGGNSHDGTFELEIRDGSSLNILFTDTFTMHAFQDAKN